MRAWRVARSLLVYRREIDTIRPNRSKYIDGTIGDADHQKRTSDHNPWVPPPGGGVVTAMDVTDDEGTLTMEIGEILRRSKDPRIKYYIGERKMFSSYATRSYPAWTWRPYSGANAHTSHGHLSVQPFNYDDESPWGIARATLSPQVPAKGLEVVLKVGDVGNAVTAFQDALIREASVAGRSNPFPEHGPDGIFGEKETKPAVERYQRAADVPATGQIDGVTAALLARYITVS